MSVSNAEDKATLWGFIRKYAAGRHARGASRARPSRRLCAALLPRLRQAGEDLPAADGAGAQGAGRRWRRSSARSRRDASGEELQNIVYAVGKEHAFEPLRAWFSALYEVLLGQSQGPRFGGFIELYGVENTRALIERALKGELLAR